MGRICANCGFDNVAGRTICKQCQLSLLTGMPAPVIQADALYAKRMLISFFGAIFIPFGVLLLYVTIAGKTAFINMRGYSLIDIGMQVVACLAGMFFMGIVPAKVWVRVSLAVLYIPLFIVADFIFQLYFACFSGRGCV